VNQKAEELKTRTKQFALDIIRFVNALPLTAAAQEMGRQLLRAGMGVAGNYRGACRSRSHREFTARIGVVLEEADESELWLDLFDESKLPGVIVPSALIDESRALRRIFVASNLTARRAGR
jgi:four helix bundle protein